MFRVVLSTRRLPAVSHQDVVGVQEVDAEDGERDGGEEEPPLESAVGEALLHGRSSLPSC